MNHTRLVVGNWKMNPASLDEAKEIARKVRRAAADLSRTETVVCPPFIFLSAVQAKSKAAHYHIGAQSVSFEEGGAHTGEVSASMLRDSGIEYVIAGHSEMRAAGESDAAVSKKVAAILESGLIPILCVGEASRDESGAHFDFVRDQLRASLDLVPKSRCDEVIVAYEPVWAIGASEAMKPEEICEMGIFVRKTFADIIGPSSARKVAVLYGGAVTFRNAGDIMKLGQVDGLLVGRESVNATGFVELLKTVDAAE